MAIYQRQIEERIMRHERILNGALEVFKAKGLENATESGFGTATLYYYFQYKEEVFVAILENGWRNLWISLESLINRNDGPRKVLIHILLKTAEIVQNLPGLYDFLFNAPQKIIFDKQPWKQYQDLLYATLTCFLQDGIKVGEFPHQIDPKLLFKAMGGLFMIMILMGNTKDPVSEKDIEKLLNQLIMNPTQQ